MSKYNVSFTQNWQAFLFQLLALLLFLSPFSFLSAVASDSSLWNTPYPKKWSESPVLFSSFSAPPKHLDSVVSYSSNEWGIISQIYEPLVQYHYFKRPYTLVPLTLKEMPEVVYLDKNGNKVSADSPNVAFSEYHFHLRDDVYFQPHPAFSQTSEGKPLYTPLSAQQQRKFAELSAPTQLPNLSTRRLTAEDYVYAIKRMGLRQNHSPILPTMAKTIVGLKEFSLKVSEIAEQRKDKTAFFDLRPYDISGVKVADDTHFSIRIHGVYPQFLYWLSMNFFAPIPWEAVRFYHQPFLTERNITLDTFPVGTGAYYLAENNPNLRMRLVRNPNFHSEFYPSEGLPADAPQKLLEDAGKRLPFIEEVVFSLEKESVPLWNKFLQGYYDASGVSSDSFDQAISIAKTGMQLTPEMQEKGVQMVSGVQTSIMYMAFNMLDPVVGGLSEPKRKLRQAISIALNYEEYISLFLNERGIVAQSPIPPGIFGHLEGKAGIDPYVYDWLNHQPKRKPLSVAKKLLAEAGYPNGISIKTGEPLKLFYDAIGSGADVKSQLNWMRKQFKQLGIELVIRATDYNRFQDKVRQGKVQLFSWGWNADYPDPENFLFLLYGPNGAVVTQGAGINSANYNNPEFNRLFEQMKNMPNTPQRLQIIKKMVRIAQRDAPWVWGFHPKSLSLFHHWYHNVWPNLMANNTLKYRRIDGQERIEKQRQWNHPVRWPFALLALGILALGIISFKLYRRRQCRNAIGETVC